MEKISEMIDRLCPEGVMKKTLGEICEIKGRIGFRGYTRNDLVNKGEGAITLSPADIKGHFVHFDECSYITWMKYNESPEIMVHNGDIILCKTASVGKVAIVENLPCEATINPQLVVLKDIKSNNRFLYYCLVNNAVQTELKRLQGIGSVPNVSQEKLSKIEIPLPPLAIQQEIVRILDSFTSMITNLETELASRQKQYEYYRNKLLTFDENDESVEWKTLGSVCNIKNGKDYKHLNDGIYPVWGTGGIMKYVDSYTYDKPSVLLPRKGSIDKVYYTEQPFWNVDTLFYTEIHTFFILPKFLYLTMTCIDLRALDTSQGNRPSLTQSILNRIPIPIPSLSRQQEIVSTLDTFESLISNIKQELEARKKQYEFYREQLLTFKPSPALP